MNTTIAALQVSVNKLPGRFIINTHLSHCLLAALLAYGLFNSSVVTASGISSAVAFESIEWRTYGGGKEYARHTSSDKITPANIKKLAPVWSIRTNADEPFMLIRTFANTPLMIGNSLFVCTPEEDLLAIDPETGDTQWRFDFSSLGRDHSKIRGNCWGIVYHQNENAPPDEACRSRLLHVTQMGHLFAVDATNGKICSTFGDGGVVSFRAQEEEMFTGEIYNTTVPIILGNTIVVGNSPSDGVRADGPKGYIRAFDVLSGELLWTFRPIPGPEDKEAYLTWAPGSAEKTGAANVWSGFSADAELGLIYAPIATVAPDYYGGERIGDNLYANSLVALNVNTGQPVWHYQLVHHDVWDYDLPSPPLLVDLDIEGRTRKAAIQLTKMGMIFTFDRETGEPLYAIEERPVPQVAVPGEKLSKTQPFPVLPPPLIPHTIDFDNLYGPTPKHVAECEALVEGMPSPEIYTAHLEQGAVQVPGALGGSNWGGATYDSKRQTLVVPVNNFPLVMALNKKTSWAYLKGVMEELLAFRRPYLFPLLGTPYGLRMKMFASKDGTPCIAPPWSKLVAVDMSTGSILWEAPLLDKVAEKVTEGKHITLGGAISTAGGVTFIAATPDEMFRAFETSTGRLLWEYKLPAVGNATPMSYEINGEQYVVLSVGGSDLVGSERSDHLIAFRLPSDGLSLVVSD